MGFLRNLFNRKPQIRMPRRFPRILMTESMLLALPDERREPVKLTNLSAGGARIRCAFPLPVHQRVTAILQLGAGTRQNLSAHVVYCQRDRQGLHYVGGLSFTAAGREGIPEIAAFIEDEQHRRAGARDLWRG